MKKKSADFTSLYLYVQKGKKFPAGHPQIFIKYEFDNIDITDVFGLVKCCILPPRDLFSCFTCSIRGNTLYQMVCMVYSGSLEKMDAQN